MQFKLATVTLAFATLAAATSTPTCTTGSLQCCDNLSSATDPVVSKILALLGIDISSSTAQVGVTCSPISVVGVGGDSCTAQPVCCSNNSFNGVVALGCTPISVDA